MDEKSTNPKEIDLDLLLFGHSAFQYLWAGCRLGVFALLSGRPNLEQAEIAAELDLKPHSVRCLLLGLSALGLIEKSGVKYRNGQQIEKMFVANAWQEFCEVADFQGRVVYPGLLDFVEAVREGESVGLRHFRGVGETLYLRLHEEVELQNTFFAYLRSWPRAAFDAFFERVDFKGFRHVLDIGGGDGTNAIRIATRHLHLSVTVLDLPSVCRIARERVEKLRLSDRISIREADIFVDQFPVGCDCVVLIHQLVIWSMEKNRELVAKAYQALPPGGVLIIFSSMTADSEDGPLISSMDTAYFVAIPAGGGMIYPWRDYERLLESVGFRDIERVEMECWTPHGALLARK
jgi:L-tyrosine C(3)-methyltransferase